MRALGIIFFFLLLTPRFSDAQQKAFSGVVRDAGTNEALIGCRILLDSNTTETITTNAYGFFSATAREGKHILFVQYPGYITDTLDLTIPHNEPLALFLTKENTALAAITVTSVRKNTASEIGIQKLNTNAIQDIPVLFGEKDILKTLQLLPGIKSAGDGNSGFYVRGGGADQNLILLDETPLYNAAHLLGFFSTFNSDAIKDAAVYKGNMPAEYGGRLSSVVDVKTRDGNDQQFHASGGIGLIASRLNLEGPLKKDKSSFLFNARRTYVDAFFKLAKDSSIRKDKLSFYDLNAKANYRFNDKNQLFISAYHGRDNLGFSESFNINWGNTALTTRFTHIFSNRLFSNTLLSFSDYRYNIGILSDNNDLHITSHIRDMNFKQGFQFHTGKGSQLDFGFSTIYHIVSPTDIQASQSSSYNALNQPKKYSLESAAWLSHQYQPSDKWKIVYGIRLSDFSIIGPGVFYSYDADGNAIDSSVYNHREWIKNYLRAEPRLAVTYYLNNNSSIQLGYDRTVQNLHLLSNSTAANPTDLWVPSSNNIRPETSDQISTGYFTSWNNSTYELSSELYYRRLQNQIDYKDGAQLVANVNVESQLLFGHGRAYGWENILRKNKGRLTGWISYTLARTERQFDAINQGRYFPAKQDRTHEASIVGIYRLNPRWTFSATWIYYTGNAVTFPSGKYMIDGIIVNYYTERNGYRMPAYHRLDLGATLQGKKTAKYESSWNFSLYNAYGRENAYSLLFKKDPDNPDRTIVQRLSLFKFIPSVTYNFKF